MGVSRRDLNQSVLQPASEATRAVAYLRENIHRIITMEELASGIQVSPRTLNRKINQELGISPYELILRIRVQAAAESLLKTADSITAIALAHGFCDQSHFTQHFRKRNGHDSAAVSSCTISKLQRLFEQSVPVYNWPSHTA